MRRWPLLLAVLAALAALFALTLAPRGDVPPPRPSSGATAAPPAAVLPAALPPPVDFAACDRDADLFGTVTDEAGEPIPGALVATEALAWGGALLSPFDADLAGEKAAGPSARTAADGTYRLALARGQSVDLVVTAIGYMEGRFAQRLAGERADLVLRRLGAGCVVEVTVRTADGEAVAGARLRAFQARGPLAGLVAATGVTGPDGAGTLDGLDAGQVNVTVRVDGRPEAVFAAFLVEGAPLRREVVLTTGRTISGLVTDAATGEPIAGALVMTHGVERPAVTGPDGRYEWPGYPTNRFGEMNANPLRCRAEGYADLALVVPIDTDVLDFALLRGTGIAGRVLDEGGRPVAGAMVEAVANVTLRPGESHFDRRAGRADAEGRFLLSGLEETHSHTLLVRAEGHGRILYDVPPPAGGAGVFDAGDIVLPAGRRIEGVVLDQEGRPAPDLLVEARGGNEDRGRFEAPADGTVDTFWCGRLTSRTDDLGRFRFRDLSPGRYRLCAPLLSERQTTLVVDLEPGADLLGLVVRLPEGKSVTVLVTDPDGAPLPNMSVLCDWNLGWRIFRRTGPDGRTTFRGLPDNPVVLTVDPPVAMGGGGWFTRSMEVLPGDQEVTIPVRVAAEVKGIVLDPEGNPLAGMYLSCRRAAGEAAGGGGFTDERGRFSFLVARGFETSLLVLGAQRNPKGFDFRMTPYRGGIERLTGPAEVEIRCTRIETDRRLALTVVSPDGEPIAGARVKADGQCADAEGVTGLEGRVEFTGLDPDYIWVYVSLERSGGLTEDVPASQYYIVRPGVVEETLRIRRAERLTGIVLAPDGSPAAGAQVMASTLSGAPESVVAGEDGSFALWTYADSAADVAVRWIAPGGEPCYLLVRGVFPHHSPLRLVLVPLPPGAGGGF